MSSSGRDTAAKPCPGEPPALDALPAIPRGEDGGPVFREPWEAQAFALAVKLHEAGCFTWTEWARCISEEIAAARRRGDPDLGDTYYHHWLRALERLVVEKRIAAPEALATRAAALIGASAADPHDHDHNHDHPH